MSKKNTIINYQIILVWFYIFLTSDFNWSLFSRDRHLYHDGTGFSSEFWMLCLLVFRNAAKKSENITFDLLCCTYFYL